MFVFIKNLIFPTHTSSSGRTVRGYGTVKDSQNEHEQDPLVVSIDGDLEVGYSSERKESPRKLNARMISDAIIGLSDGLTVPFALTAGLTGLGDTRVVVLGGLAELIAGAISMGLGGYIGAKSEAESYQAAVESTRTLIQNSPTQTEVMVEETFAAYGLSPENLASINKNLHHTSDVLLDFLMRFHLQQAEPDVSRPTVSAATIALGYFVGGFIPLVPYFFVARDHVLLALWWSVGVMAVALFIFGWAKTVIVCGWAGRSNIIAAFKGGVEMVVVGGVAAGAAVLLVRGINNT